jgi:hypothetical protein
MSLSHQVIEDTVKHHFNTEVMDTLTDSLASILAVGDPKVKRELAAAFLASSFVILANSLGKEGVREVNAFLREKGII